MCGVVHYGSLKGGCVVRVCGYYGQACNLVTIYYLHDCIPNDPFDCVLYLINITINAHMYLIHASQGKMVYLTTSAFDARMGDSEYFGILNAHHHI